MPSSVICRSATIFVPADLAQGPEEARARAFTFATFACQIRYPSLASGRRRRRRRQFVITEEQTSRRNLDAGGPDRNVATMAERKAATARRSS